MDDLNTILQNIRILPQVSDHEKALRAIWNQLNHKYYPNIKTICSEYNTQTEELTILIKDNNIYLCEINMQKTQLLKEVNQNLTKQNLNTITNIIFKLSL